MPDLTEQHGDAPIKLLNIGDSKSGKTGALASLAKTGYNLWILDYDNGLDILRNVLRSETESLKRIKFETLRDKIIMANGVPKIKPPVHAYQDAGRILEKWGAEKFTSNDVLVIDSLTTFSDAAFNQATFLAGRLNQRPQLQDYGWLADSIKLFIEMITSPELSCHVVVNSHVRYFSGDDENQTQARGLPNARGQEISRVVSRYFDTVILTRSIGTGPATRRLITTQPQGVVEVATSNPKNVKPTYPVEEGMAPLFKDLLGHGPVAEKPSATGKLSVVE